MTTVYFVRHAQSDASVQDPFLRPLTEQGLRDRRLVTEFLSGREVAALFSSPYKRAVDTLADFAEKRGLPVQTAEDFREHETISDSYPDENYFPFIQKYWEDPAYKVPGDESLEELQQRNVRVLETVLEAYPGKTVAIATHGMALSAVLNFYDAAYGYEDFLSMVKIKPWVVKLTFQGKQFLGWEPVCLNRP